MSLAENYQTIRARLMNPPNAKEDLGEVKGINIKNGRPVIKPTIREPEVQTPVPQPQTESALWDLCEYASSIERQINTIIPPRPKRIRIPDIQELVCRCYGVPLERMLSIERSADVTFPRHVAIYLSKTLTKWSFPQIGRQFGRDHTTVLYSVRKIAEMRLADPDFDAKLGELTEQIERNAIVCLVS